ncbi:hypothetical protein [Allorhizocola rhizosphaerae]|nr:hypothetical protein [Allorhizocola rhizosphaerae]
MKLTEAFPFIAKLPGEEACVPAESSSDQVAGDPQRERQVAA